MTDAPFRTRSLLSREAQVLLLTAGGPDNDAQLRQLLDRGFNWPKLGSLAAGEKATPIVWRSLQRVGTGHIPPDVETAWRQLARVSEFESLRLERLLHQALKALARRGIEVMLLKGGALAYTAYASFRDRPMGDVDLMVVPDRASEAWSLLQEEGWKWWSDQFPADWYRTHHHLPPLFDASTATLGLEIHRAPFPPGHPFELAPQTLWQCADRVSVDGRRAWVPGPLHGLLHLCIHFAWSHEMHLGAWRAFRDLATLTAQVDGTIDWAAFVDLARESRAVTCCHWTLRLARNLTGAHVPQFVLQALRPTIPEFVLNGLERHYAVELFPSESRCPSVRLSRLLWELGIAPRSNGHGSARPWTTPCWVESIQAQSPSQPRSRLLTQMRGMRAAIRYLGRITAATALPASGAPKMRSVRR